MDRIQENIDFSLDSVAEQKNEIFQFKAKLHELMQLGKIINERDFIIDSKVKNLAALFDIEMGRSYHSTEVIEMEYFRRITDSFKQSEKSTYLELEKLDEVLEEINKLHLNDKLSVSLEDKKKKKKVKI